MILYFLSLIIHCVFQEKMSSNSTNHFTHHPPTEPRVTECVPQSGRTKSTSEQAAEAEYKADDEAEFVRQGKAEDRQYQISEFARLF